ncbi:nucleoside diphosphate-linked moiety X motif 17-like [Dendronephthya gigantea]|uniref:nucleoside diphosphate-linked moiety X motif 17-like n=1 Tax=Dendronephthya gigantea TaxID=151771 RepID=UPI00106BD048|nr:nucleoside diphosphate-linked moiety X motif 17-like [Dendronephthya gigantea]
MSKALRYAVSLLSNDQKAFISAKFEQCCLSVLGCQDNQINVAFQLNGKELRIEPNRHGARLEHPESCPCRFLTASDILSINEHSGRSGVRVGVSFVIQSADGCVLLTKRPKTMRSFPNIWVTPGGHIENGETLIQAGIREIHEETGVLTIESNITMLGLWESVYPPVLGMGLPTAHHIVVYMLARLPQDHQEIELKLQESEVSAAAWLDGDTVAEIVQSDEYGKTRNAVQKYFKAKLIENGQQVDKNFPLSILMACMPTSEDWTQERLSSGSKFALRQWLEHCDTPE